jgi:PAS domain S-box-containing protein/putative nucleotidyltransferase with HDIG domain
MVRMVGFLSLAMSLAIGLVSYVVYARSAAILRQATVDHLEAVATSRATALQSWVDDQRRYVVFIAWLPEVRNQAGTLLGLPFASPPTPAEADPAYGLLASYLKYMATNTSDTKELFILDLHGQVILSTDASHEGLNQAEAPYFVNGLSTTYVQTFYRSDMLGEPTITISTPLFDGAARRVGVLASHLDLVRLDRIVLERSGLGSTGEVYLADQNGYFISADLGHRQAYPGVLAGRGLEMALQGHAGWGVYQNYADVPVIGVYRWLDQQKIALLAEQTQAEAFAPARQLAVTLAGVGLLAVAFIALGVYWLARQIAKPIITITNAAVRVADGDLEQTVPVLTQDEVGVLANTFNVMTLTLRQTWDGLEHSIADLEKMGRALRSSEEHFRRLAENAPDIIYRYRMSPPVGYIYVSPAVTAITGYTPEEHYADPDLLINLIHPDDRYLLERARLGRYPADAPLVMRWVRKNGSLLWTEQRYVTLTDESGASEVEGIVRDITERVEAEEALRRRNRELALINRIIASVTSTLEPEAVLALALRELAQGLDIPHAAFTLWDEAKQYLTVVAEYPPDAQPSERGLLIPVEGNPAAQYVLDTRRSLAVADAQRDPRMAALRETMQQLGVSSTLIVPLVARTQVLGTLGLDSYTPREFNEQEITLAANAASAVAQAIENAHLFAETLGNLEREQRLNQVAHVISSSIDLPTVLQDISRLASGLIGASSSALALLAADGEAFEAQYLDNLPPELHGPLLPKGQGLSWSIVETRQPIFLRQYAAHPNAQPRWVQAGVQAFLGVPVVAGEACLGAIGFFSFDPDKQFGERDLALAETVGRQAGVAIQNARLFDETRRRALDLESLLKVSSALRQAADRAEIVAIGVDWSIDLLAADGVALLLREPASKQMLVAAGRGRWTHWAGERRSADQGLVGWVMASGEFYRRNALQVDFRAMPLGDSFSPDELPVMLCAPLITREQVIGILWLGREAAFSENEVNLLGAMAEMVATSLHRATLHEQVERRLQRMAALRAIDIAISASLDLTLTLNILVDHVINQLRVDAADVLLYNAQNEGLRYAAGHGFRSRAADRLSRPVKDGFSGQAVREQRLVTVPDLPAALSGAQFTETFNVLTEGFITYFCMPLVAKGQLRGVLEIFLRSQFTPDPEWLDFLQVLSGQAAIAIDNAELFSNLQRSNTELEQAYDTTLEGWTKALDLRDKETEGHTLRVTELSLRLARAMGISEAELVHMRRGALLHDIGKIAIPDSILLKPAELIPDERSIMRQHPQYAYDMLAPIAYLRPALDIPYCHHEWWDGSGYPRGLAGEDIPLAARIFAVVDVWDALSTDRPYRKAWPQDQVRQYLYDLSGKQFQPQIVEAFLALLDREKS